MMNLTRTILLLTLLLGACGPLEYPGYVMDFRNEQAMQAQVLVNRDPYTGLTTVQSPFGSITRAGYDSDYFILLGTIDQKQQTTYRVRVHHVTSDWKFLEHAYSAGHEVPMAVVDRIAGINVAEIVDLPLTRAEIEQIAVTSWQVKLIGQRGDLVVSVPAPMVRAFLNVFDQQMRAQNPAS